MAEILKKKLAGKSLLTLLDYSAEEINYLLDVSKQLKKEKAKKHKNKNFSDKNIVLLFQKDSTRTRCAFEVAGLDLGMGVTYIGPHGSQVGTKESIADTARVLGRMYDGIGFRGYKQSDVQMLAKHSGVPVWNGLTDKFHPTQILADFLTIREKKGILKNIKLTYVGDARNNVAHSLMVGCAKLGIHFCALAPMALWPDKTLVTQCRHIAEGTGANIILTDDVEKGSKHADVIYTDVWVSMGEPKEIWEQRLKILVPYQVNMDMLHNAKSDVLFLHCLPAVHDIQTEIGQNIAKQFASVYKEVKNGEVEVTDEVFESKHSVVFDVAENRMHTIKALMFTALDTTVGGQ